MMKYLLIAIFTLSQTAQANQKLFEAFWWAKDAEIRDLLDHDPTIDVNYYKKNHGILSMAILHKDPEIIKKLLSHPELSFEFPRVNDTELPIAQAALDAWNFIPSLKRAGDTSETAEVVLELIAKDSRTTKDMCVRALEVLGINLAFASNLDPLRSKTGLAMEGAEERVSRPIIQGLEALKKSRCGQFY